MFSKLGKKKKLFFIFWGVAKGLGLGGVGRVGVRGGEGERGEKGLV
jgi:hypothetical protein